MCPEDPKVTSTHRHLRTRCMPGATSLLRFPESLLWRHLSTTYYPTRRPLLRPRRSLSTDVLSNKASAFLAAPPKPQNCFQTIVHLLKGTGGVKKMETRISLLRAALLHLEKTITVRRCRLDNTDSKPQQLVQTSFGKHWHCWHCGGKLMRVDRLRVEVDTSGIQENTQNNNVDGQLEPSRTKIQFYIPAPWSDF